MHIDIFETLAKCMIFKKTVSFADPIDTYCHFNPLFVKCEAMGHVISVMNVDDKILLLSHNQTIAYLDTD